MKKRRKKVWIQGMTYLPNKRVLFLINFNQNILKIAKGVKDDVRCMKETLKMDKKDEFFDFHDKVNTILEE